MSKTLFLDIETTGFSREWDEIIEIAAILIDDNTGKDIDSFHEYIKPKRNITPKITNLTRITNAQVASCRSEQMVLMDFSEWVTLSGANIVIGHNCKAFDLNFIKARCDKFGIKWAPPATMIDTLALARQMNKEGKIATENNQQQTLAKYFGVAYEAHSAIEDTKALIKIYNKMTAIDHEDVGF
jgi:DNA polymerase III alpha subunit (gram-positive type)